MPHLDPENVDFEPFFFGTESKISALVVQATENINRQLGEESFGGLFEQFLKKTGGATTSESLDLFREEVFRTLEAQREEGSLNIALQDPEHFEEFEVLFTAAVEARKEPEEFEAPAIQAADLQEILGQTQQEAFGG